MHYIRGGRRLPRGLASRNLQLSVDDPRGSSMYISKTSLLIKTSIELPNKTCLQLIQITCDEYTDRSLYIITLTIECIDGTYTSRYIGEMILWIAFYTIQLITVDT